MKKNIITVLFFAVLCIVGCKSKNGATDSSAAGHTHSESCTHSHEGHSHDAHLHEAHNHSEHEHNHSAHSHDAHGHDEGLHAGEIKFSKAQAEADLKQKSSHRLHFEESSTPADNSATFRAARRTSLPQHPEYSTTQIPQYQRERILQRAKKSLRSAHGTFRTETLS